LAALFLLHNLFKAKAKAKAKAKKVKRYAISSFDCKKIIQLKIKFVCYLQMILIVEDKTISDFNEKRKGGQFLAALFLFCYNI